MPKEPLVENDTYEAAELGDTADLDEDEVLARIEASEKREAEREILLDRIAVARHMLYEARAAGDEARMAELRQLIADLNRARAEG